ncbi:hypothetical protein SAMN05216387_101311 [Nitrosovibrio tenuis]|uniref:Uncharacterized protein n=1 Tax=Nitrosovibrio tenuis TaxID=1233 RepID=A0A1H7GL58_9PROT|nr:hypothetical protein SAMN05216387_101311 [Nitrosovibrio tenuis]
MKTCFSAKQWRNRTFRADMGVADARVVLSSEFLPRPLVLACGFSLYA